MNKKVRNTVTYIAFLTVGVLLLYLVYNNDEVDPAKMWGNIQMANFWLVLLSAVMGYLAMVSRGLRWLLMLEPMNLQAKPWNSIHSVVFAYFANTFVPRSGEIARCGVLNQTDNLPVNKLIGTVISERVIDFVMLFALITLAFFSNVEDFKLLLEKAELPDLNQPIYYAIAGGALVLMIAAIYVFRSQLSHTRLYMVISGFLQGVLEGLKTIYKMKKKGLFIAHTLFIWGLYFLMSYVIFYALPSFDGIEWNKALFVMVAGGLGMVFPAPGGVGSFHWAAILALTTLTFTRELATEYATVVWTTQTGMIILTGLVSFAFITRAKVRNAKLQNG